VSLTKTSTDESVRDQGEVGCVFDWKGIVHHEFVPRGHIMNSCTRSFGALEGCFAQEGACTVGKPDVDVAPRQCTGTRVAHPQLSGKTSDIRCAPSNLFPGLRPSRPFPVSQT
jgi:hypothetical protein